MTANSFVIYSLWRPRTQSQCPTPMKSMGRTKSRLLKYLGSHRFAAMGSQIFFLFYRKCFYSNAERQLSSLCVTKLPASMRLCVADWIGNLFGKGSSEKLKKFASFFSFSFLLFTHPLNKVGETKEATDDKSKPPLRCELLSKAEGIGKTRYRCVVEHGRGRKVC